MKEEEERVTELAGTGKHRPKMERIKWRNNRVKSKRDGQ